MTRKLNIVLLTLLIFVGGPFYWLLLNAHTSETRTPALSIGQLRRLAMALPDEAPVEVRYEDIGHRWVMRNLLAAGSGLRKSELPIRAYELVLPDDRAITIDRGMSRELAQENRIEDFDPAAQAAVERAVAAAPVALVLAPRVHHSGLRKTEPGFGAGRPSAVAGGSAPYVISPGIVAIPLVGVSLEERMIYVRTIDGQEFLFTGDIAPIDAAWAELRPPARLTTSYLSIHDREAVAAWLRAVRRLKSEAPSLQIVAGHEPRLPRGIRHGFIQAPDHSVR